MKAIFGDLVLTESNWMPEDRPLDRLYIPILRQAESYDRMSGYFSEFVLIDIAAGLVHFIANGGVIRLLMGSEVSESLISSQGLTLDEVLADLIFSDPDEKGMKVFKDHARETLGWMLANGRLVLRICTPRNKDGYFHPKIQLFSDREGREIAVSGSANESRSGWRANYEQFTVQDDPGAVAKFRRHFSRLFDGQDPDWVTHDLPTAIAQRLIALAPQDPPGMVEGMDFTSDGVEVDHHSRPVPKDGDDLIIGPIVPLLYHQESALEVITSHWGRSYLIADEVGLGKTIEIGAVLRWGIENNKINRALILTPASVLEQWQTELRDKVGLAIPRYERGKLFMGKEVLSETTNPWQDVPFLLASSQLARGSRSRDLLMHSEPWDLLVIDEAHHARLHDDGKKTLLLRLLDDLVQDGKANVVLAASATPIQSDRRELFGLMNLLQLPEDWRYQSDFLSYFSDMESFQANPNGVGLDGIRRLHRLARAYLSNNPVPMALPFDVKSFLKAPTASLSIRTATPEDQESLVETLRSYSPLGQNFIRETRQRLREYQQEGIAFVGQNIPTREISNHFIQLPDAERRLYESIDEYIRGRFEAYSKDKKTRGLGFLMTVYRRRLTSSFASVSASLSRRLDKVALLDSDDTREVEGDEDTYDILVEEDSQLLTGAQSEEAQIRAFLADIDQNVVQDAKTVYLIKEMEADEARFPSVVIFTIFTDTMDWLREELLKRFGVLSSNVTIGCYSGRGGEIFDPSTRRWKEVDKSVIGRELQDGRLKILIGTDAMSEGLNLQWSGKLINFDMPWNLMRVEQRIGRLDRIGSTYPKITISNYFIEDTVEADIYKSLLAKFGDVNQLFAIAPIISNQIEKATIKAIFSHQGAAGVEGYVKQIAVPAMPWE